MTSKLNLFAAATLLAMGASNVAMAQYACPPGYAYAGGVCQPAAPAGYGNPVSGAVSGTQSGAASGYSAAGPIGAVVGGALGTAAGTLSGTANMITPGAPAPAPSSCPAGYAAYPGGCYPAR